MEEEFLAEIEEAAARMGIAPTTLCRKACGNGSVPDTIRKGGTVRLTTVRRVREFIDKQTQMKGRDGAGEP